MKKSLFLVLALLALGHAFAQTTVTVPLGPSIPQQLDSMFRPLNKAEITSGLLFSKAIPLVEPTHYKGSLNDTNAVNINTFGMLYTQMRNSNTLTGGSNVLPSPSVYLDRIRQMSGSDTLPLALMALRYHRIRPDAIAQGWVTYSNGQLHDVPGRTQSPYWADTTFVASLLTHTASTLNPVLSFPMELVFQNLGWPLASVEVDADDGLGWRSLPVGGSLAVAYPSEGDKDLRIRYAQNGKVWYAHTRLHVALPPQNRLSPEYNNTPDEVVPVTGIVPFLGGVQSAQVQFFYHCGAKQLRKPLIILEGFEFPGILSKNYVDLFEKLNQVIWDGQTPQNLFQYLTAEGYDLVYVNFANNADYIQRNAYVVEEVIRLVNQKKAAAGSYEQNVVLGVSLGGVMGKFALLDMQARNLPHDTRLFITLDSPLRGANIPVGTQCMMLWLQRQLNLIDSWAGGGAPIGSSPLLDNVLVALAAPAPSQLLLITAKNTGGGIEISNPPAAQSAFLAALDGMGALSMRHVALSNGAGEGTALENDFVAGGLMYTMLMEGYFDFETEIAGIPTNVNAWVSFSMDVKATGNLTSTNVFEGYLTLGVAGIPNLSVSTQISVPLTSAPLDAAPGGNAILGAIPIAGTMAPDGTPIPGVDGTLRANVGPMTPNPSIAISSTITCIHPTFIPTFSSVSAAAPSVPQACGTPNRCDMAMVTTTNETTGLPEVNQAHTQLDARIGNVLRQELRATTDGYPFGELPGSLTTYYNVGDPAYNKIKSVVISTSNGKLSVNNQGKVAYAIDPEPNAPLAMYDAYTACDAEIVVESGATLAIGGDHAGKDARLWVAGADVVIMPGGRLVVHNNSSLIIQNGASVMFHPGAILILRDNPDGPLVENGRPRIKIESGGKLVAKGDITIQGDGHFEFDPGNIADLPENFTLTGFGKPYRFVRVNAGAEFKKTGGNFILQDGLVEVGQLGRVLHEDGGISRCLRTKFQPTIGAQMPHKGLEVVNGGTVQIQHSDFLGLQRSVFVTGAANLVSVLSSRFEHTVMEAINVRFASMTEVVGENASFVYNGVPTSLNVNNCTLNGSYGSLAPLRLTYVKMTNMTGGIIDVPGGICIDATANGNNITLRKGATLQNGAYGIHLNGGLFGGPNAYNYGLVTMDCARILNCAGACITGRDALLNIDADINSSTLRPNEFSLDPSGPARYFDICYVKRDPGASIRARRNFWNKFDLVGNSIGPAPDDLNLVRSATVLGCEAGTAIPLLSAPAAAGYNPACPIDGYTGDKPAPGQGAYARRLLSSGPQGRLLSDKDCSMGGTDLHGNSTGAWAALYAAFDQSALSDTEPDLSAALALFSPVANFDSAQLSGATDVCRQYVNVAQIFVLPTGVSQQRASERSDAAPSGGSVLIAPNPAAGAFTVTLPSSPCTLRVWDARGRLAQEVYNASGLTTVDASGWAVGLYLVEVTSVEGKSWGKVVVER